MLHLTLKSDIELLQPGLLLVDMVDTVDMVDKVDMNQLHTIIGPFPFDFPWPWKAKTVTART